MTDRKRVRALLLCIGFALVLSVSFAFLILEADHDCCGEDCPVCRTIAMTTSLLRALLLIAAAWLSAFVPAMSASSRRRAEETRFCAADTPVRRKIRMND